jgi:hypothetical protein
MVTENVYVPPVSFLGKSEAGHHGERATLLFSSSSHRCYHLCPGDDADPKAALSSEPLQAVFNGAVFSGRWTRLTSLIGAQITMFTRSLSEPKRHHRSCVGCAEGRMSMQVVLPAKGAWQGIVRGSSERLEALRADVVETKYQLREMLERLGKRHGIRQIDLDAAMECYVNDLLADLTFRVELHLENEIETETQH